MTEPEDRAADLDAVLIGGREPRKIVIVDYDERWPVRFLEERARVLAALGDVALRIEHIGSTAVPGLAAKPIIDVLVTVADPDNDRSFKAALEKQGYQLRVRESGHRMFRTAQRDAHVHVWSDSDPEVDLYLRFRERLRLSAEDRAEYERLKARARTARVVRHERLRARKGRADQRDTRASRRLTGPRDPAKRLRGEGPTLCRSKMSHRWKREL